MREGRLEARARQLEKTLEEERKEWKKEKAVMEKEKEKEVERVTALWTASNGAYLALLKAQQNDSELHSGLSSRH